MLCREWYEAYGTPVYNYFRFHVPLPDVAEDLTAETFLKVVRAADRFDPSRGSPKAWILTVARNVLGDWRRRAKLRQYVALGTMHDLVHEAPSPEERLLREEEVGRLLDAVAALGDADRELIGLRYGSGLDTAEVAQMRQDHCDCTHICFIDDSATYSPNVALLQSPLQYVRRQRSQKAPRPPGKG